MVVWDNTPRPEVYAARSTDGGATFPSYERLNSSPPAWTWGSYIASVTADGTGNVWAAWLDLGAGAVSVVARHSSDYGASWGGTRRVHRDTPQGAFTNNYFPLGRGLTAAPGVAYFGWVGQRGSWSVTPLLNAWDLDDFDRDGAAAGTDCNARTRRSWPPRPSSPASCCSRPRGRRACRGTRRTQRPAPAPSTTSPPAG